MDCYPQFIDEKTYVTNGGAETQNQDCVISKPMLTKPHTPECEQMYLVEKCHRCILRLQGEELSQYVFMLNPLKCQLSKSL